MLQYSNLLPAVGVPVIWLFAYRNPAGKLYASIGLLSRILLHLYYLQLLLELGNDSFFVTVALSAVIVGPCYVRYCNWYIYIVKCSIWVCEFHYRISAFPAVAADGLLTIDNVPVKHYCGFLIPASVIGGFVTVNPAPVGL